MDAFRIALTEEPKLLTKQKLGYDSQYSILLSSSDIENYLFLDFENMQMRFEKSLHNFKENIYN